MTNYLFAFLCCLLGATALSQTYTKTVTMSPEYKLSWTVDEEAQYIYLAIEAKTTGWVGFGIGEPTSGSMPGSDILTGFVDNQGAHVTDRYAIEFSTPIEDTCQDWVLIAGSEAEGTTTIEVKRKLKKTDNEDRDIVPGVNRVVWSMGRTDSFTKHFKQGTSSLVFYGTDPNENQTDASDISFDISTGDTLLNPIETDYQCAVYRVPFLGDGQDYHIVEFDAIIDPKAVEYVHHFVLSYCINDETDWYQEEYSTLASCGDRRWNSSDCQSATVWAWAPGINRLSLPPVAGFRAGASFGSIKTMHLQVHYHNPEHKIDIRDNSTIRVKYTPQPRQYDAGVIQIGDVFLTLPALPPQQEAIHHESTCSSQCTSTKFPHDLHIFGDVLHMHATGSQIYSTVWRNDELITTLNRIEYWQFNLQQTTPQNFTLKPGDRINLHCIYNTMERDTTTMFGRGSEDEMCLDFIYYYPKVGSFEYCGSVRFDSTSISICEQDAIFEQNPVPDTVDLTTKLFGKTDLDEAQCPSTKDNDPWISSTTNIAVNAVMLMWIAMTLMVL